MTRAHLWLHPDGVAVAGTLPRTFERLQRNLGVEARYVPRVWVLVAPPEAREALARSIAAQLAAEGYDVVAREPEPVDAPPVATRPPELTLDEQVADALEEMRATGRR